VFLTCVWFCISGLNIALAADTLLDSPKGNSVSVCDRILCTGFPESKATVSFIVTLSLLSRAHFCIILMLRRTNINNTEQVGVAVKLWDRIREELCYRVLITLRISLVFFSPSMEVKGYYLDLATRAIFQNNFVCHSAVILVLCSI
jgi:hypothetical protein